MLKLKINRNKKLMILDNKDLIGEIDVTLPTELLLNFKSGIKLDLINTSREIIQFDCKSLLDFSKLLLKISRGEIIGDEFIIKTNLENVKIFSDLSQCLPRKKFTFKERSKK